VKERGGEGDQERPGREREGKGREGDELRWAVV
jgi:hypothetical protein